MGFFSRTKKEPPNFNDPLLSDGQWLDEGERRYSQLVSQHYGSPDTIAAGGDLRMQVGDVVAALHFYTKSIDTLHSIYVANAAFGSRGPSSWRRRPSNADFAIVDRYLATLRQIKTLRPNASPRDSVIEVTHRLRTISSEFKNFGIDNSTYLDRLDQLAQLAPEVDVSGVFWT